MESNPPSAVVLALLAGSEFPVSMSKLRDDIIADAKELVKKSCVSFDKQVMESFRDYQHKQNEISRLQTLLQRMLPGPSSKTGATGSKSVPSSPQALSTLHLAPLSARASSSRLPLSASTASFTSTTSSSTQASMFSSSSASSSSPDSPTSTPSSLADSPLLPPSLTSSPASALALVPLEIKEQRTSQSSVSSSTAAITSNTTASSVNIPTTPTTPTMSTLSAPDTISPRFPVLAQILEFVSNLTDKDNISAYFREVSTEYLTALANLQNHITDCDTQIANLNSKLHGLRLRMKNMSSLCSQGFAIPEFSRHMSSLQLRGTSSSMSLPSPPSLGGGSHRHVSVDGLRTPSSSATPSQQQPQPSPRQRHESR